MVVIIAGSRKITQLKHVEDAVRLSGFKITRVISGGAGGVDVLGELWARDHGIDWERMAVSNAEWKENPKIAGFLRNRKMGAKAEGLIAVWDEMSTGTAHMIATALVKGIPVFVHCPFRGGPR